MSCALLCPDWPELVRARSAGDEPAQWQAAQRHLRSCADCRRQALALDPTLVFQLLPEPIAAVDEISAMHQRVAHARRDRATAVRLARHRRSWPAAAAAAGLALMLTPVPEPVELPAAPAMVLPAAVSAALEQLPLVEAEGGDLTPVYEWSGAELSIVLLADERRNVG